MSIRTKITSFSGFVLLTHLGCEQSVKKKNGIFESKSLTIDQDFSSEALNDKVLIPTKLRETDLKRPNLKDYLLKHTTYPLFVVNILASCGYLLPLGWLHQIETPLVLLIWFMVLMSVLWLMYYSFIALIRAKIYYFFGAVCVAIVPFLSQQIVAFFFEGDFSLYLRVNLSLWLLAVISMVVLSVFQLREKLVTRRRYDANLHFLKESMEEVRKIEVEAIGRNLHDNVGNILASALGYLNLKSPNTHLSQHLVKEAINEIRFLSHNLVKDEDLPLSVKLEALIGRFNDFSNILFLFEDFSVGKINQLEKTSQQNIYMITQEVLTNIIKHSKATETFVQIFERENATIQLTIEDDGMSMQSFAEREVFITICRKYTVSNYSVS